MRIPSLLFVTASIVACGNDHGLPPAQAVPDGAPGPDAAEVLHDVTIRYRGAAPMVFAYRNGRGEWHDVDQAAGSGSGSATTVYTMHVTSDFLVAAVCTNGDSFDVEVVGGLVGDGSPSVSCLSTGGFGGGGGGGGGTTHALTGTMAQAGSVAVRTTVATGTGPWQFSFDEPNGTYDVVALDASASKMALVRGVTVTGADVAVDAVDLDATGVATVAEPLDVSGADASAQFSVTAQLTTATARTTLPATIGKVAHRVPAALLEGSDQQTWTIAATAGQVTQSVRIPTTGTAALPHLTLVPAPTGVAFATDGATVKASFAPLPADPDTGSVRLVVTRSGTAAGVTQKHGVNVSLGWLAQNPEAASSLEVDTTLPGFDAAMWGIGADEATATLSLVHTDDATGTQYTSTVAK